MEGKTEEILARRMHGLYLSRKCDDIENLAHNLLGMHCWFSRNVPFSALIRGADISGWKDALTKTWLYRGTLHGVCYNDLSLLLSLHTDDNCAWILESERLEQLSREVINLMEDGVHSRSEMRLIFSSTLDSDTIGRAFSPWGGVFVYLARRGKVAFRNMKSRDFDLIDAPPLFTKSEAIDRLLPKYFAAYGPATLADAEWFFGVTIDKTALERIDGLIRLRDNYYYIEGEEPISDIPELTLLSGFDPLIVSYQNREAVLKKEYRKAVILSSGICLPTVAINGKVEGVWNIKGGKPTIEFFSSQPKRLRDQAYALVYDMQIRTKGRI